MGIILVWGGQLNQCYWFINQINTSNSFHPSVWRRLLITPVRVSVALNSHFLQSQTCLQGDCCTFQKSYNISFPLSEKFLQNSLLEYIISQFGFHFSDPYYTTPHGSSLNEIKRIFLLLAEKLCIYPPFRRTRFPFKAITDINCHLYLTSPFWKGGGEC